MISLTIWIYLWSSLFVLAPPPPPPLSSWNINPSQNLEILSNQLITTTTKMFMKRRKIKVNYTKTMMKQNHFDINSYRSSWKFIEKDLMIVRFRLSETIIHSIGSVHFLVRHSHTGHIKMYNESFGIINSTVILHLHKLKHGRHSVCLLIYTLKQLKTPRYIFCQDISFNFHKYGLHDTDTDEHKNTIFFLLTQYAIVIGILCILQLTHIIRKRRLLRTFYNKANSLRNLSPEYNTCSQGNRSSSDFNNRAPYSLEYLIYNLNRNSLYNFDQMYIHPTNDTDSNSTPISNYHRRKSYNKHLKLPNRQTPLLQTKRHSIIDDEESDIDIEQSTSFKSLSHILEGNKPWITKLNNNGNIQHSVISKYQ